MRVIKEGQVVKVQYYSIELLNDRVQLQLGHAPYSEMRKLQGAYWKGHFFNVAVF